MAANKIKIPYLLVGALFLIQACTLLPEMAATLETPFERVDTPAAATVTQQPPTLPTFHLQLMDYPIDTAIDADYFGVDLFETDS
ncbi:MAG: hypothetical protein MUP44_12440, partial [Anaerolineales bacterium]|nr:hypothetical protein [Anaerolineales bacterium]